jgi:hypothetical protein
MTFSWADRVAPTAPEQPQSLGEQYRAWQRAKAGGNGSSGSAIYDLPTLPEQRAAAAQRPSIYAPREYGGLDSYAGKQRDALAQKPGESYEAYERRLKSIARALPDGEVERRLGEAKKLASEENWSWEAHRAEADTRTTGASNGSGILSLSPGERSAAWNGRPNVTPQEHLSAGNSAPSRPASMAEVAAAIQARDLTQRSQQPQHPEIPAGSSGTGFLGVDR